MICFCHRVHTEWQRSVYVVHSVMMEKSAQPGEGGGMHAHPLSLYLPSRSKRWYTLQLRGQIHPFYFLLYPFMYLQFLLRKDKFNLFYQSTVQCACLTKRKKYTVKEGIVCIFRKKLTSLSTQQWYQKWMSQYMNKNVWIIHDLLQLFYKQKVIVQRKGAWNLLDENASQLVIKTRMRNSRRWPKKKKTQNPWHAYPKKSWEFGNPE